MASRRKRTKNLNKWLLLGGLTVLLVILVAVFFSDGAKEKVKRFAEQNLPKPAAAPSPSGPVARTSVTLFFLSEDDDLLHKETREIPAGPSTADEAERVIAELVKGSFKGLLSPLPPETRVRQVFVSKEGVAYVDLSREAADKFAYGSSSELGAVYSIVNSLAYNFKSVKRVTILVEGAERETLGGHIDISRPIAPDFKLVAR
jgi:spore germination protein GerM